MKGSRELRFFVDLWNVQADDKIEQNGRRV